MSGFFDKIKHDFYLNSSISILDNNQILVENCKNILECNDILVRIISSDFEIEIWGANLTVTNFSSKTVSVNGEVQTVTFIKRRKS